MQIILYFFVFKFMLNNFHLYYINIINFTYHICQSYNKVYQLIDGWPALLLKTSYGLNRAHAIGAIDMAVWDVVAKIEGKPLYQLLGERYNNGAYDDKIYTYGAGGYYYEENHLERLKDELKSYLDMGFRDVKIKIAGADLKTDLKRIEAALSVLGGDGSRLMVDANGRYDLKDALECALAIKKYGIKWYEEPLDPLDYSSHLAVLLTASPFRTDMWLFPICRVSALKPRQTCGL